MKRHDDHSTNDGPLYSEIVRDFAALADLRPPSAHTVLLLVADSTGVHTDIVSAVAEQLFAIGLTYLCVWGPGCQRVHDIFDEVYVGDSRSEPEHSFMSTWHHDEPLDAALWFFLHCANPDAADLSSTSFLAVTVGNEPWAAAVEHALADTSAFVRRILADEA
ncbi:MAG: hypothetical protein WDN28_12585 [Chthoniobacter sp.]